VYKQTGHKIKTHEHHPIYTILPVTSLSVNYNNTQKPRLKYEIK